MRGWELCGGCESDKYNIGGLGAIGTCSDVRLYALSNRKMPADDVTTSPSRVWNDTILDRER